MTCRLQGSEVDRHPGTGGREEGPRSSDKAGQRNSLPYQLLANSETGFEAAGLWRKKVGNH